jgi:hypothetical protein
MAVVNAELLAEGRSDRKKKQLYRRSKRIIVGKHVLVAPCSLCAYVGDLAGVPVSNYGLRELRVVRRQIGLAALTWF